MKGREDVNLNASGVRTLSRKRTRGTYDLGSIPQYHMVGHARRLVPFDLCPEIASCGISLSIQQRHFFVTGAAGMVPTVRKKKCAES